MGASKSIFIEKNYKHNNITSAGGIGDEMFPSNQLRRTF